MLIAALKQTKTTNKKQVLFMDELPWMDTKGSDFLLGLDFFWNSWASAQKNMLLIVCGSSTSWIINNLFSDTGGLYNRVTGKIKLDPFTLQECALFFAEKGFRYTPIQCIEAYMVFGGIPYYLNQFAKELSPVQNINELCFGKTAFLKTEYILLFKSLFAKYDVYLKVVDAICSKNKGLTRAEIAQKTGLSNGGSLTAILQDLEHSNFIKKYTSFNKKTKGSLFQMIDSFCLFYNNLNSKIDEEQYWINNYNSPTYNNWAGYAFEIICLNHVPQIKKALGIQGMLSNTYSWQNEAAQIDLVLDRADNIINLFEIKYTQASFVISKKYDAVLRTKIQQFTDNATSKKAIWPVFISPYGLSKNGYSHFFTHDFKIDILFERNE